MDNTQDQPNLRKNCPAVRIAMFPKDTNGTATNIFGGVILSHMDIAGAIAAHRVTSKRLVTVAFDKVVFKKPVHIGDVLTCWAEVIKTGRTSITTKIIVEAERRGEFIPVTEGEAVYVCVDSNDRPIPIVDEPDQATPSKPPTPACTSCRNHPAKTGGKKSSTSKRQKKTKTSKPRKR